jgi:hypothetical protein
MLIASHRRLAVAPSLPPITGSGNAALPTWCGSKPWFMAEAIVSWVRKEAAPRALELGSPLRSVSDLASVDVLLGLEALEGQGLETGNIHLSGDQLRLVLGLLALA